MFQLSRGPEPMVVILQAFRLSNTIVVKKPKTITSLTFEHVHMENTKHNTGNASHVMITVFECLSLFNLSLILSHSLDLLIKKKR